MWDRGFAEAGYTNALQIISTWKLQIWSTSSLNTPSAWMWMKKTYLKTSQLVINSFVFYQCSVEWGNRTDTDINIRNAFHSCDHSDFQLVPTKRKTLLSGLTLCFSMYFMRLLLAYLKNIVKQRHFWNNIALRIWEYTKWPQNHQPLIREL